MDRGYGLDYGNAVYEQDPSTRYKFDQLTEPQKAAIQEGYPVNPDGSPAATNNRGESFDQVAGRMYGGTDPLNPDNYAPPPQSASAPGAPPMVGSNAPPPTSILSPTTGRPQSAWSQNLHQSMGQGGAGLRQGMADFNPMFAQAVPQGQRVAAPMAAPGVVAAPTSQPASGGMTPGFPNAPRTGGTSPSAMPPGGPPLTDGMSAAAPEMKPRPALPTLPSALTLPEDPNETPAPGSRKPAIGRGARRAARR